MKTNLLNIILFQLGWWLTFVVAIKDLSLGFLLGTVLILAVHIFYVSKGGVRELSFCLSIALMGFTLDTLFHNLDILVFNQASDGIPPIWLASMWVLFPTTIGYSLNWLSHKKPLAFVFAAVGGPLSYYAGSSFSLLSFPSIVAFILYAVYWGVFFVAVLSLYDKWFRERVSA